MTVVASSTTADGSCVVETVVDGSGNLTGIQATNTFTVPVTLHLTTGRGFDRTFPVLTGVTSENIPGNRRVPEAFENWTFTLTTGG